MKQSYFPTRLHKSLDDDKIDVICVKTTVSEVIAKAHYN